MDFVSFAKKFMRQKIEQGLLPVATVCMGSGGKAMLVVAVIVATGRWN